MNRHYNTDEYYEIVLNIRKLFNNPSITTDVMVGFPSESESEFLESVEFVKKVGFSKAHVFAYSRRPGTKADLEKNQITKDLKASRSKKMIEVTNISREKFLNSQINTVQSVLFERYKDNDFYEGYTKNYTPVLVKSDDILSGKIFNVEIQSVERGVCIGKLV